MGCDIHAYIDYDHFYRSGDVSTFQFASPFMSRNYHLFGLLAGVRTEGPPIVEPRGFPARMAGDTEGAAYLSVTDSSCEYGGCNLITSAEAEDYIRRGSQRVNKWHITNPDHHTPSWLVVPELREVIKRYEETAAPPWDDADTRRELRACLAAMLMLDEDKEGRSRFVFWFDS